MTTEITNLDDRFIYRLIKVMYITSFILFLTIILSILYEKIPQSLPDSNNSFFSCNKNARYAISLNSLGIELSAHKKELDQNDRGKIIDFCKDKNPYSDLIPSFDKDHSLKLIYKPREWLEYSNTIFWCLIVTCVYYFVLNVIRETLIYLAFGRKVKWHRILAPTA